jgi:hypothetical protein
MTTVNIYLNRSEIKEVDAFKSAHGFSSRYALGKEALLAYIRANKQIKKEETENERRKENDSGIERVRQTTFEVSY